MSSEHRKPKKLLTAEQKYDLWVHALRSGHPGRGGC